MGSGDSGHEPREDRSEGAPISAEALRMSILQKEMEKMEVERKARGPRRRS